MSRKRGSSRRISVGRLVVVSTQTHPARMLSSSPPGPVATASTSAGPGKDVSVDVGEARGLGHGPGRPGAPRGEVPHDLGPEVVDHQRVARLQQVSRHAAAHVAEADQSDGVHAASCGVVAGPGVRAGSAPGYPGRLRLATGRRSGRYGRLGGARRVQHDVHGVDAHHLDPESPGRRAGVGEPEHGQRGRRRAAGPPSADADPRPDRVAAAPLEPPPPTPSPIESPPEGSAGGRARGPRARSPRPRPARSPPAPPGTPRRRSRRGAGPPSRGRPRRSSRRTAGARAGTEAAPRTRRASGRRTRSPIGAPRPRPSGRVLGDAEPPRSRPAPWRPAVFREPASAPHAERPLTRARRSR